MESAPTSLGKRLDLVDDISSLQFTLIHGKTSEVLFHLICGHFLNFGYNFVGSNKYPVKFSPSHGENSPTVEDLANLAARLTQVPPSSQRLIFKGRFYKYRLFKL